MYQFPQTIPELRQLLAIDPLKAKVKFCVKLLRVLRFTLEHPELTGEAGARWCADGTHFICNAQILGKLFGLRANSINTNLRSHDFVIDNRPIYSFEAEFGTLPDLKCWKIRRNATNIWVVQMTEEDADKIPAKNLLNRLDVVDATPRSRRQGTTCIPDSVMELISGQEELEQDIISVMNKTVGPETWKGELLTRVAEQWLKLTSNLEPIAPSVLVKSVIDMASPSPPSGFLPLIEANLNYLLAVQGNSSQMSDGISFVDFLRLVLRFGFLDRIAFSLYEVSDPSFVQTMSTFPFFFSQFSQSQQDANPCFAPWFSPSCDQNTAAAKLSSGLTWVIRMALSPNLFTIQLKNGKITIATHIKFDAMPLRESDRYSVEFDGGTEMKRGSWQELIEEVLNLEIPVHGGTPINHEHLQFVPGNIVAAVAPLQINMSPLVRLLDSQS